MIRARLHLLAIVLMGCQPSSPASEPVVVPAEVRVEPGGLTLAAGEQAQLSAQVNDALGQPIGGAPIHFDTSDPAVVQVTTAGLASSAGRAGVAQVIVSSGARRAVVPITVRPGAAGKVQKLGGDGQRGAVRTELEGLLAVKSVDAFGNAVSGVRVRFSTPDGGAVSPSDATTAENGVASVTWTLGPAPGVQRLSAVLEEAPAAAEIFTATAHPGAPARLAEVPLDGPPAAAGAEAVVRVRVTDAHGNPIPGAEVAWRALSDGAALSSPATASDAGGVAEVRVRTAPAAGVNRVEAHAAGLAQPLVLSIATVPGPAARVELVRGDGQTGRAGRPLRAAPSVRVVDAHGNALAGVQVRFEVEEGRGAVEREAALTDAEGVASCGRWTLGGPGPQALTASVEGVRPPATFTATARRR